MELDEERLLEELQGDKLSDESLIIKEWSCSLDGWIRKVSGTSEMVYGRT